MAASPIPFLAEPISGKPTLLSARRNDFVLGVPRAVSFGFRRLGLQRAWRTISSAKVSDRTDSRDSGVNQLDVPLLSGNEIVERLKEFERKRSRGNQEYMAMYSSIYGGITTDPAAMLIPMDDHMVHRGHGVFDTAAIMDGHLYELDQHLDRFLRSASMAKIPLPFDRLVIRAILIRTTAASECTQGSLRYWLSAGPGDFLLSPSGCPHPALYAVVIRTVLPNVQASISSPKGIKVITSSVPMKPPQFAVLKSTNYLPNVLSKMEAEEQGAFAAVWLDDEGNVAEGPNMNVGFVTRERILVMPKFDKILSGCTARRVLALAERLVKEGRINGIAVRDVTMEEGKEADEMMLIGSGIIVKPVVQWDEQVIGNGMEGPVATALFDLILEDMKSGPCTVRVPVPY